MKHIQNTLHIRVNKVSSDIHFHFILITDNIFNQVNIHFHFHLNYLKIVQLLFIKVIVNTEQIMDRLVILYGQAYNVEVIKNY